MGYGGGQVPSSLSLPAKSGMLTFAVDVVKALCLGATAVGVGRPFLYAQSVQCFFLDECLTITTN